MKAIVITQPGAAEVLLLQDRPKPIAQAGEVLIKVKATAVNRADVLQRMGRYPAPPGVVADIPGMEYSGIVEELGTAVQSIKIGDRVYGLVAGGSYAEYLAVDARLVAKIPDRLSYVEAAASLPL